jgi:SNF2 family DNA or RNA helicase
MQLVLTDERPDNDTSEATIYSSKNSSSRRQRTQRGKVDKQKKEKSVTLEQAAKVAQPAAVATIAASLWKDIDDIKKLYIKRGALGSDIKLGAGDKLTELPIALDRFEIEPSLLEKEGIIAASIQSIYLISYDPGSDSSTDTPLGKAFAEYVKKATRDTPQLLTLYSGTLLDVKLLSTVEERKYSNPEEKKYHGYYIVYALHLPKALKELDSLFKSLGSKTDKAKSWVLLQIADSIIDGEVVPSIFTSGKISTENQIPVGTYKLASGGFIYVPKLELYQEDFNIFTKVLSSGEDADTRLNKNSLLLFNKADNTIICTDDKGKIQSFALGGLSTVTNIDKKNWMNKSGTMLQSYSTGSLNEKFRWTDTSAGHEIFNKYYPKNFFTNEPILGSIEDPDFQAFIRELYKLGVARYRAAQVKNWLSYMGILTLLGSCFGKSKAIITQVETQVKKFQSVTGDEAPAIPCMNPEIVLFPHQAEALAKLNVAKDNGIIDVATGGGKTGIIFQDALNQMQTNGIKRPLVIMPNALIGQWMSEVHFFSALQFNVLALTTETLKKYEQEEMEQMIKSAPPNTIFLTTYAFIRNGGDLVGKDFEGEDRFQFPNAQWILDTVEPDYVALDESQIIKKSSSKSNKAVTYIGDQVQVRRIATGTLITNTPKDLIGQLKFLDPAIVGNETEFANRYAIGGNISNGWKEDFADQLRQHLRDNTAYLMYREKDWAPLLPKRKYTFDFVDMSPAQTAAYKALVHDVVEEIMEDPELKDAWLKMQDESDDEMEGIPAALLGKLAKLEQFLTAPEFAAVMKYTKGEFISPKIKRIDELIGESINDKSEKNNKVIVAVHFKIAADHLMRYSKYKNIAAYYDASNKQVIGRFQNDPNLKVIFAVQASLSVGLNLQVANRIILADIDWTPGNLKQLEARIFRPHVKIVDGKLVNLNKDKTVYINTVVCNDSADVCKFAFQAYKKILNASIMENSPVELPPRVGFSEEALAAKFEDPIMQGPIVLDKIEQHNKWLDKQIEEVKAKGDLKLRQVKTIKDGGKLGTTLMPKTPWVAGMTLPLEEGEEPLATYLEQFGYAEDSDMTEFKEPLHNLPVRTEWGTGIVTGVSKGKKQQAVRVKVKDGTYTIPIKLAIHTTSSKKQEKLSKKKDKQPEATRKDIVKNEKGFVDQLKELLSEFGLKLSIKHSKKKGTTTITLKADKIKIEDTIVPIVAIDELSLDEWRTTMQNAIKPAKSKKQVAPAEPPTPKKKALEKTDEPKKKALDKDSDENVDVEVSKKKAAKDTAVEKPVEKPKKKKATPKEKASMSMEVYPGSYNDIPCLISYADEDEDEEQLLDYGFNWVSEYWSFEVQTKALGERVLSSLKKKFTIPSKNIAECEEFLDDLKKGKYPYEFPEEGVRNFLKLNKKKAPKGTLRIYPLVIDDYLYFVVDSETHPGVSLSRFKFEKEAGFYIYYGKTVASLKSVWKKITKDFNITNRKKAIKLAKTSLSLTLGGV